jgi:hypothetical protein
MKLHAPGLVPSKHCLNDERRWHGRAKSGGERKGLKRQKVSVT